MIKDVILNLEPNKSRDSVRDYAITAARTFDAHLEAWLSPMETFQLTSCRNFLPLLLRTYGPNMKRLHAAQSSVSRRRSRAAFSRRRCSGWMII